MAVNWRFLRSLILSLLVHSLLIVLLIFSVDTTVKKVNSPVPQVNIVKAVSEDEKLSVIVTCVQRIAQCHPFEDGNSPYAPALAS